MLSKNSSQVDVLCGGYNNYITCAVPVNEWTHLVSTFNNGICKLYKNGVYIGEKTGQAAFVSDASNACIGRETYASGYFGFNGCINDVRIYDHCLSPAEVHEIAMGLVLHYKLDKNKSQLTNVYNYPTFDTSNSSGGWSHWGQSGASGAYGQNTDKKYIWNKNNTYSHWVSNSSSATGHYLLYQSPDFDGGYRSAQCIVKEENELPITTSIVYAVWNAQSGGLTNNTFSSITHLGDGFYLCKAEGIKQDGSNDLVGFYVKPGYKVYFSEAYLENNKEMCSDIFEQDNLTTIEDSSGYGHNGTIINAPTISSDTSKYSSSINFNGTTDGILIENLNISNIINTAVTYSFWIKPNGENGMRSVYFGSYSGTSWSIEKTSGNLLRSYWNGSPDETCSNATITDGVWQHICLVKNGTNSIKAYINGVQKWASTATHSNLTFPTTFRIGRDSRSNDGTPYKGQMSDFRIYCTPLLDNDIKMLYNIGMRVDNLQNLHTFEYKENTSNLFRSELIMPWAKANRTSVK